MTVLTSICYLHKQVYLTSYSAIPYILCMAHNRPKLSLIPMPSIVLTFSNVVSCLKIAGEQLILRTRVAPVS